jgi:hypothetical protein
MANITPVAAFRASLEKGDGIQPTITQLYRKTEHSSDDDDFVNRPSRVVPPVTPNETPPTKRKRLPARKAPKKKKVKHARAADTAPKLHPVDTPERGDIVMATARDINHPALHYGDIGKPFIVFGVIQSFQTVEDWIDDDDKTTTELIVVDWMTINRGKRYIHLGRSERLEESESDLDDHFAFIPAVEKSKVVLVAKRSSPQLGHLNDFLALAVGGYYTFNDRWCRI